MFDHRLLALTGEEAILLRERQTRVQPNRPKVRKLAFSGSRLTYRYSKFLHPRKNQLCSTVYKSIIINLDSMCPFSISIQFAAFPIAQVASAAAVPSPAHGRRGVGAVVPSASTAAWPTGDRADVETRGWMRMNMNNVDYPWCFFHFVLILLFFWFIALHI